MKFFRRLSTHPLMDLIIRSVTSNNVKSTDIAMDMKLSIFVFLLFSDYVRALRKSSICGIALSQEKIVGGVDSGGYRYPWFALLLLKRNSYLPVPVCAGSLISRFHVLTAAHCFTISSSVQHRDLFSVALGVYDICNDAEDTRQIFNVEDVAIHEKYRRNGKFYDIALIKLSTPAGYVAVCLPIPGVPDITEVAVVIGFGMTRENDNSVPCHMMEANVTKYSKKDCSTSKLPRQDVEEPSVICAGSFNGDVDSCYGDSGGPLQTVTPDGRYVIAGIVSYGYGCATPDTPGVYTNVGSYLDWINSKMFSLGYAESNVPKGQNAPGFAIPKRKGTRRRPSSSVFFPGQDDATTQQRSPIDVQYYGMKSDDRFNEAEEKSDQSRKTNKDSSVTFPK